MRRPFVEPELHAQPGGPYPQSLGDFRIEEGQQAVPAIHQRDLHPERAEDRRVLAANDPAANYRQTLGDAIHPQEGVGIKNPDVVESYFRWTVRLASGDRKSTRLK